MNEVKEQKKIKKIWVAIHTEKGKRIINFGFLFGAAIMLGFAVLCGLKTVAVGAEAVKNSYSTAYETERDAAYQTQYQKYFDRAEADYHVSNRVSISIGDIKETASLEVLRVSDVEYIVDTARDNGSNVDAWLEVPGTGVYVVDLQAGEFVVDNERGSVLVRVPCPELKNITIDYANVKILLFKNDIFNESYSMGEELARKQLTLADSLIKKEFSSNQ